MTAHLRCHPLAIPVKNNKGGFLLRHMAVDAIASNDVWAVGDEGVFHYDGNVWTKDTRFSSALFPTVTALAARAPDDVWAGGNFGLLKHFNGQVWEDRSVAGLTDTLTSIAAPSQNDVWIASQSGIVVRWNGSGFQRHDCPASVNGIASDGTTVRVVGQTGAILRHAP